MRAALSRAHCPPPPPVRVRRRACFASLTNECFSFTSTTSSLTLPLLSSPSNLPPSSFRATYREIELLIKCRFPILHDHAITWPAFEMACRPVGFETLAQVTYEQMTSGEVELLMTFTQFGHFLILASQRATSAGTAAQKGNASARSASTNAHANLSILTAATGYTAVPEEVGVSASEAGPGAAPTTPTSKEVEWAKTRDGYESRVRNRRGSSISANLSAMNAGVAALKEKRRLEASGGVAQAGGRKSKGAGKEGARPLSSSSQSKEAMERWKMPSPEEGDEETFLAQMLAEDAKQIAAAKEREARARAIESEKKAANKLRKEADKAARKASKKKGSSSSSSSSRGRRGRGLGVSTSESPATSDSSSSAAARAGNGGFGDFGNEPTKQVVQVVRKRRDRRASAKALEIAAMAAQSMGSVSSTIFSRKRRYFCMFVTLTFPFILSPPPLSLPQVCPRHPNAQWEAGAFADPRRDARCARRDGPDAASNARDG